MDSYVPEEVQLPTLIVCNERGKTINKSLLEEKGMPRNMFSGLPLNLNIVNTTKPFPNLEEMWDMVTLDLDVSGGPQQSNSGLRVSKVNTLWQGRCLKIENEKAYPGGKRIASAITLNAGNNVAASISVSFVYDVDIAGIIVDYTTVPYHEVMINIGSFLDLRYG